jgi:hypothetical protein
VSQQALIFGLDPGSRVLRTYSLAFTSAQELRQQLETELDRYARIEAWVESVCVLRLSAVDGAD